MNMFKPEIGVGRTWFPFYLNGQSPSLGHFSLLVDRRRVSGAGTIHLVPASLLLCTMKFASDSFTAESYAGVNPISWLRNPC